VLDGICWFAFGDVDISCDEAEFEAEVSLWTELDGVGGCLAGVVKSF